MKRPSKDTMWVSSRLSPGTPPTHAQAQASEPEIPAPGTCQGLLNLGDPHLIAKSQPAEGGVHEGPPWSRPAAEL